jgi:CRISPR-associated protein Cas1
MAYVTEAGAILRAEGNTIIVTKDDEKIAEWKLIHLSGIVIVGRATLTTAAMEILLKESIPVAIVSRKGKFLGRLEGARTFGLQVRLAQLRLYDNPHKRLLCAKRIVEKKIDSMASVVGSYASNYSGLDLPSLRDSILQLKSSVTEADTPAYLRGVEGSATRRYWEAF